MKRANFTASHWEARVIGLLERYPETVAVFDTRKLAPHQRQHAHGIWHLTRAGKTLAVPFQIAIAAPATREVRFEVAEMHDRGRNPGAVFSEAVQLIFVCVPESAGMLALAAHEVRELLQRQSYPQSATQVSGRDVRGVRLSECALVPLHDLAALPGAAVWMLG